MIKDIPGYEGLYAATDKGQIWSYRRKKFLDPQLDPCGYYRVFLWDENGPKTHIVHRIIATLFVPNPEGKPTVDHINRIKTDNRASNLRWATYKEQYENSGHRDKKTLYNEKEVEMRDKDDHSILYKTFSSVLQAATQEFGDPLKNSLIYKCAKGFKPSAYGYWWHYVGYPMGPSVEALKTEDSEKNQVHIEQ